MPITRGISFVDPCSLGVLSNVEGPFLFQSCQSPDKNGEVGYPSIKKNAGAEAVSEVATWSCLESAVFQVQNLFAMLAQGNKLCSLQYR